MVCGLCSFAGTNMAQEGPSRSEEQHTRAELPSVRFRACKQSRRGVLVSVKRTVCHLTGRASAMSPHAVGEATPRDTHRGTYQASPAWVAARECLPGAVWDGKNVQRPQRADGKRRHSAHNGLLAHTQRPIVRVFRERPGARSNTRLQNC